MLCLSRRPGESIMIGKDIKITLIDVHNGRARIGIEADKSIEIWRSELTPWTPQPEDDE